MCVYGTIPDNRQERAQCLSHFFTHCSAWKGKLPWSPAGAVRWVRQWRKVWRKLVRASPFLPGGSNRRPQSLAAIETGGGTALALSADVRERAQVERACATIVDRWERVDILVNAAGGNMPGATLAPEASLLDLDP
jgi:NAD(P)-dependent dehydrogenase (short-subunit alcohol dehydrogenase family)